MAAMNLSRGVRPLRAIFGRGLHGAKAAGMVATQGTSKIGLTNTRFAL